MTDQPPADEALRSAFQALADSSGGECSREDLDRIWLAVGGELSAAERRELVERLATDAACAEAWRIAHELRGSLPIAVAGDRRSPWRPASWLAAAAGLVLAAGVVLFVSVNRSGDATFRDPGQAAIESLVPSEAVLPRDAFRLRWTPGPQDARYQVQVTTEDLRLLVTTADLTRPEVTVDAARLADVPQGSRLLWQVEVTLPNGERTRSSTFVTRVQ